MITGFPGETADDAACVLDYLDDAPLTHLHVFPYSDRPGTAAESMEPKVAGEVLRERATRLREVGHRLTDRFVAGQVGHIRNGLTIEDGSLVLTDNYLKLRIPAGLARNRRVRVRVVSAPPPRGEVVA